jgi:hypothetical protein
LVSGRHRGDRALGFLSSRPNWDPPPPSFSPADECVFHSLVPGGGTHSLGVEGVGDPNSDEETHIVVLNIYVLRGGWHCKGRSVAMVLLDVRGFNY